MGRCEFIILGIFNWGLHCTVIQLYDIWANLQHVTKRASLSLREPYLLLRNISFFIKA